MVSIFNTMYRGIEIACESGDITQARYGAIVVSTDRSFSLNAGVGHAVLRAGGAAFQQLLSQGKQNLNGNNMLVVQGSGNLQAANVILVSFRGHSRPYMESLYRDVLQEAVRLNVTSVAIPPIGCGAYGYPLNAAAEHARDAIQNCTNFGSLTKICFMDIAAYPLHEFRDKLSVFIHPNGPSRVPGPSSSNSHNINPSNNNPANLSNVMMSIPGNAFFSNSLSQAQQNLLPMGQLASSSASAPAPGPSPPKKKRTGKSKSGKKDEKEVLPYRVLARSELPKPTEDELKHHNKDDPFHTCSICLSDMEATTDSQGGSTDDDPLVQLNKCSHIFHKTCIEAAFKTKAQCPNCLTWYAPAMGNQPKGGHMNVQTVNNGYNLGFVDARGHTVITYSIPGGVQTQEHPRPGVRFTGTHRTAFLPNNQEGNEVLRLLQLAFERRLIFTVGDSITSGLQNTVVWNNIHHKTSTHGGTHNYGYPDEDYLRRVKEELAAVGIRVEMLEERDASC